MIPFESQSFYPHNSVHSKAWILTHSVLILEIKINYQNKSKHQKLFISFDGFSGNASLSEKLPPNSPLIMGPLLLVLFLKFLVFTLKLIF